MEGKMQALGTHLLVELRECNEELLDDVKKVKEMMVSAAKEAKATVIGAHFHRFSPHGISGVVVIAESHLSIHTWPEYGYAAVDVFTCGDVLQPFVAGIFLAKAFESKSYSIKSHKRGVFPGDNPLPHKPEKGAVVDHDQAEELQLVS
jgi:S-adenosylmethionine decarboxylase